MPANTTKGWPYILPADNVADYPVTSQALATKADTSVPFAIAQGQVSVAGGAATGSQAVVFPAGLFSVTPLIFVAKTSSQNKAIPFSSAATAAGFTAGFATGDGTNTAGAVTVYWLALQLLVSAPFASGVRETPPADPFDDSGPWPSDWVQWVGGLIVPADALA